MADFETELRFVGQFWGATTSTDDQELAEAWTAMAVVGPDHLEHPEIRSAFEVVRLTFAAGESTDPALLGTVLSQPPNNLPPDLIGELMEAGVITGQLAPLGRRVTQGWQRRAFLDLCQKATAALGNGQAERDGGRQLAERMTLRLMQLYEGAAGGTELRSKDQILDAARDRAMSEVEGGLTVPYPKLERHCGPWMPGEIIGVSGYSGDGKSTFAANLAAGFARRGVPFVAFPTEMGDQWLDRLLAAEAGVQQWRAEKRRWKGAEEHRRLFIEKIEKARGWEFTLVDRADITPVQIATAVRVLRQRWPGQPVVVLVDHMHRLNYGDESPDDGAGPATKVFKNLAREDAAGLVFVLLYQPRKPADKRMRYSPAAGYQIRGHSTIWNELDIHLSTFRSWVKVQAFEKTPWGTNRAQLAPDGGPVFAKVDAAGAKLDDEHFYIKVDKRRVGGEGPKIWLNFQSEHGRIYERADLWAGAEEEERYAN